MANRSKLAVILHADVVGSTALVRKDESLAHDRIQAAFRLFSQALQRYGGTVHEIRGDALVAEFSRASDAVLAAVAAQQINTESNVELNDGITPEIRVGIALGEVVIADETITGAGVVLAQRLEQLAAPDGVCISAAVREAVPDRLPLDYSDLGAQEAKGFDKPVVAYTVSLKQGEALPEATPPTVEAQFERPRQARAAALAVTVMLIAAGLLLWLQPWQPDVERADPEKMAFELPERPSIAVLPFSNISGASADEILATGLVDDVITSLSKIPKIFVIARYSTDTYKGKTVPVKTIAEELGIRYVLEGSIQSSGDKKRIRAHLIDALAGNQIWAENYDRKVADVFALQSELALKIVTELDVELVSGERARLMRSTTSNPEAYEIFLKANAAPTATRENVLAQIQTYLKAAEIDPGFSAAWAAAANQQARMGRIGMEDREVAYKKAEELARMAIRVNDAYSGAYLALSTIHRFRGNFDRSMELVEKALSLSPNDADAVMYKGRMLRFFPGRADEAVTLIKSAMRLNPHYPADYVAQLSWAYFAAGHYKEAHEAALQYAALRPNRDHSHWRLALTYSLLGQPAQARAAAEEALRINPKRTIANTLRLTPYAKTNPELLNAEIEAMRASGFPE
jgi:adenylate cyclase